MSFPVSSHQTVIIRYSYCVRETSCDIIFHSCYDLSICKYAIQVQIRYMYILMAAIIMIPGTSCTEMNSIFLIKLTHKVV